VNKLIERDLGDWAGLSKSDVKTQYPEAFNDEGLLDFFYTPPKGEGAKIMIDRLVDFLITLKQHDEDTLIAIVTHNGVYRVLKSLITGMPLKEIFRQVKHLGCIARFMEKHGLPAQARTTFVFWGNGCKNTDYLF
jgi:broad specificity phosphatase PhoE